MNTETKASNGRTHGTTFLAYPKGPWQSRRLRPAAPLSIVSTAHPVVETTSSDIAKLVYDRLGWSDEHPVVSPSDFPELPTGESYSALISRVVLTSFSRTY